jgi:hypothetical protein
MTKYKLIVVDTLNPTYSKVSAEIAQRIGKSFGYKLRTGLPTDFYVPTYDGQVLVFNPDNQKISMVICSKPYKDAVEVWTADGLLSALKNPVINAITITSEDKMTSATIFDGTVTFSSRTSKLFGMATVSKKLLKTVMGQIEPTETKPALPVVEFLYHGRTRYVCVTKMDDTYVQGFEFNTASEAESSTNVSLDGSYKKYCVDEVTGGVNLLTFIQ